jgi:hypothetical protein
MAELTDAELDDLMVAIGLVSPSETDRSPCCTGDRRGYQWHQRTGNLPACEESRKANRDYMRPYLRDRYRRGKRVTA